MTKPPTTLSLAALDSRLSVPTRQLAAPGPDDNQLQWILRSASRVPDHGKRVPFRFLRIASDARTALADATIARLLERESNPGDGAIEKLRNRFTLPPLTIAVIAKLGDDEKIPVSERFSTASCVCLLLLQAAQAEGYGAQWLTGWPCYDRPLLENTLGLQPDEQLVGTIAIGTPQVDVPDRERPDPTSLLTDWSPA
ncbi:nitroreductase family protein [Thermomonas carbonis]|uniref:Putative NAD(P)H nitroreductase n=1 Tax=Thermomonas carbonis TaxID=1463158 RepID=A0A7G9SLY1_9GAMM|nr:nitroreductase [Thermomonas carbonis]QNN68856.1 nitroreductase [Thermomonas carbonis]